MVLRVGWWSAPHMATLMATFLGPYVQTPTGASSIQIGPGRAQRLAGGATTQRGGLSRAANPQQEACVEWMWGIGGMVVFHHAGCTP